MDFPRTLLLTAWRQDARYAGAEAIRRILGQLPRDRIRWCSLEQMKTEGELDLPACATFELRRPHWRLAKSTFGYLWTHELQTKRLADRIADWASDFDPELIWVLPELAAIPTATHLAGITGIPLHATLYDVLESAREICIPALYYSRYMRNVKCLFGMLSSLDTVSPELLGHVRATYGFADDRPAMAMPPSVPESWIHSRSSARREISGRSRRIGFCGAFRTTPAQWISFLDTLSELPYDFEIVAFASSDSVHGVGLPGNVTLALQPYEPSEHDVIRRFIKMDVDACYLGLWKDPSRLLFSQTSLSSKIVAYSASGLPLIVDGPESSVAWRLVREYGAGILLGEDRDTSRKALDELFSNGDSWNTMACGSERLCREELNLDQNVERLAKIMCLSSRRRAERLVK